MELDQIEFPIDYLEFTKEDKDAILDKIIDASLKLIEQALVFDQDINRVHFLTTSLKESLRQQEKHENYEACGLIKDLLLRLND